MLITVISLEGTIIIRHPLVLASSPEVSPGLGRAPTYDLENNSIVVLRSVIFPLVCIVAEKLVANLACLL